VKSVILNVLTIVITYVLFPVLVFQGKYVRSRTPILPAAGGSETGFFPGTGNPIYLLAIGESSIAGVGALSHEDALVGQTAFELNQCTGHAIIWHAKGRNGYTAEDVRKELVPSVADIKADIVLIGLGVNDVLSVHGTRRWVSDLERLVTSIRSTLGNVPVLLAGVPHLSYFPSLPQPLRTALGLRSRMLDYTAIRFAYTIENVAHCPTPPGEGNCFSTDRFHPGPSGYNAWGFLLAGCLSEMLNLEWTCSTTRTGKCSAQPHTGLWTFFQSRQGFGKPSTKELK